MLTTIEMENTALQSCLNTFTFYSFTQNSVSFNRFKALQSLTPSYRLFLRSGN